MPFDARHVLIDVAVAADLELMCCQQVIAELLDVLDLIARRALPIIGTIRAPMVLQILGENGDLAIILRAEHEPEVALDLLMSIQIILEAGKGTSLIGIDARIGRRVLGHEEIVLGVGALGIQEPWVRRGRAHEALSLLGALVLRSIELQIGTGTQETDTDRVIAGLFSARMRTQEADEADGHARRLVANQALDVHLRIQNEE